MTDYDLIASTDKLWSLIKMTTWQAHVVHMAKHTNMVGVPFGGEPGPLGSPLKSSAAASYML